MTIQCISPIDGSVYAERETLSRAEADAAVSRAKMAQTAWATRPLVERIKLVQAGVAAIGAMNDEIVLEIAHQMGRPVRYGGEFSGFNERASYMAEIAEQALAPIVVEDSDAFRRMIKRVPHGLVLVVAPWNYPYMTAINTVAPALIALSNCFCRPSAAAFDDIGPIKVCSSKGSARVILFTASVNPLTKSS